MAYNVYNTISTPTLTIDNTVMPIVPNSASYTEGGGEQTVRTQSAGGGSVAMVLSENVEESFSMLQCQVENTQANIEFLRQIKLSKTPHVVSISDSRTGFTRTMQQAILTLNYEVGLGADTNIPIEFKGAAVV